jgi:hypothetical protein
MPKPNAVEAEDKDLPLRDDIRLLGRQSAQQRVAGLRVLSGCQPPHEAGYTLFT